MESGSSWRFRAFGRAVSNVYSGLVTLVAINILWFVMSLTIVLLPPATAALYQVAAQADRGQGPYVQDFLSAVRRLLLPSWLWAIPSLAVAVIAAFAVAFYGSQPAPLGPILVTVTAGLVILIGGAQFYFWPYMVLQEQPRIRQAIKNAVLSVLADPLLFANVALALLLLVLSLVFIFPMVVLTPVFIAFWGTYSLRDWLEHHKIIQQAP